MISTPLLALVTDVQTAIMLTIIPNIFVNIASIKSEGNLSSALQKNYTLVLLTAIGSFLGTYILLYFESDIFSIILAFAILIYLISDSFNIRINWIGAFPKTAKVVFGLLSGVMGGLTNIMAPILVIYSLESNQPKKEIIQSTNLCFLFGKIVQLALFALNQQYNIESVFRSILILAIAIIFLPIGIKLKGLISDRLYKRILKIMLLCISLVLAIQNGVNT